MGEGAQSAIDWNGEKKVNLALQGGGSHGAFTWGVLDRLLEDDRLDLEAITGTSAGAMNAIALVQGYLENGRAGAKRKLEEFWTAIGEDSSLSMAQRQLADLLFAGWGFQVSPMQAWLDAIAQYSSPYSFNPLNFNPLRDLVARLIDFEKVRACDQIKLFVAATNVHTGRIAVFKREQLTVDHVMASACLPQLFQAVEIDGVPFWDGGYMGNPALFPLFYESASPDIVIVQVNPVERKETPRTPKEIQNRLNEITFNGALLGELRAIEFVSRLVDSGTLSRAQGLMDQARGGRHELRPAYRRPFLHRIDGTDAIAQFPANTKFNTRMSFLQRLREAGRQAAHDWLAANYDALGQRDTLDPGIGFGPR